MILFDLIKKRLIRFQRVIWRPKKVFLEMYFYVFEIDFMNVCRCVIAKIPDRRKICICYMQKMG